MKKLKITCVVKEIVTKESNKTFVIHISDEVRHIHANTRSHLAPDAISLTKRLRELGHISINQEVIIILSKEEEKLCNCSICQKPTEKPHRFSVDDLSGRLILINGKKVYDKTLIQICDDCLAHFLLYCYKECKGMDPGSMKQYLISIGFSYSQLAATEKEKPDLGLDI